MNINELLLKVKKHITHINTYTNTAVGLLNMAIKSKAPAFRIFKNEWRKLSAGAFVLLFVIIGLQHSFPPIPLIQKEPELILALTEPKDIVPEPTITQQIIARESAEKEVLPTLDLSGLRADIQSNMRQINEPTAWGEEVLYSAGDAASIDGPVLTRLILYNVNTREEKEVAISHVKFGEIYEGRLSDYWIAWLDTNQSGTNHIYVLNRSTNKSIRINSTSLNRPQISLWGNFLVWSGQKEEQIDELHVFDLLTGRSFKVEDFDNPTFGTSSPAVHSNILVWAYPHPDDPLGRSVIKTLDLTTLNPRIQPTEGHGSIPFEENAIDLALSDELNVQTIDPEGFAIYPATNGKAIAWLDSLNPAQAALRLTLDEGENIITVAEGVGRFFGVGEDFIVYTQQGAIMIYFWETRQYATLTKEDEQGKLAELPVSGRTVIWYDATDPNRKQDNVKRSAIEISP